MLQLRGPNMPKSGPVYSNAAANTITATAATTTAVATPTTTTNNNENKDDEDFPLCVNTIFFLSSSYDFQSSTSLHHGILYVCHLPTHLT